MKKKEKVTRIIDGDTFRTKSRTKHSVRLAGVNAPEKGTPGAKKATNELRKLIGDQKVEVKTVAHDTYGRTVAEVKVGGKSVNKIMKQRLK